MMEMTAMRNRYITFVIFVSSLMILLGCNKTHEELSTNTDNMNNVPETVITDIGLKVVYNIVPSPRQLTTFSNKSIYCPNQSELGQLSDGIPFILLIDIDKLEVTRVENIELNYLTDNLYFTDDDYLYCLLGSSEHYELERSNHDGTDKHIVPIEGYIYSGYVVEDDSNSLYLITYSEVLTNQRKAKLQKIDFSEGLVETLVELNAYQSDYRLIGIVNNSFIVSESSLPDGMVGGIVDNADEISRLINKQWEYDVSKEINELKPYEGKPLKVSTPEYSFIDPYTGNVYLYSGLYDVDSCVNVENYDNGLSYIIEFNEISAAVDESIAVKEVHLIPKAATKDGFIVQIGLFRYDLFSGALPVYGYITKEEYHKGNFTVLPFDYSSVIMY